MQTSHMKTAAQRIETADTIELVPQILRLKKILVPTDFSETSKKAVQVRAAIRGAIWLRHRSAVRRRTGDAHDWGAARG